MNEIAKELAGIRLAVEGLNGMAREALGSMPKPEGKFNKAIKTVVLFAGALGILHTAELIRQWLAGG